MRISRKKLMLRASMSIRSLGFALILLALGFITQAAFADAPGIRGTVKGADGKPLAGAEVRAQRVDQKGKVLSTTTNAKGEYSLTNLDATSYAVTSVINKKPQQVASIKTRATGWVRVDFDLRANAGSKKATRKRMVWVAGETGTHIGGGHWETVEEPATGSGTSAVERVDGSALNAPNNMLNPTGGVAGPGH